MGLHDFVQQRIFGLVLGLVTNNEDPENMGRVKVKYHMFDQSVQSGWCRVVSLSAGAGRGSFWMPEVDDEVALAFEQGDPDFPYVIGSVWNGRDRAPASGNKGNKVKRLRTKGGHEITLDDTGGAEKLTILDSSARHKIVLDVSADKITIEAGQGDLELLAPAGKLTVRCKELDIAATGVGTLQTGGDLKVSTSGALALSSASSATISSGANMTVSSTSGQVMLSASQALRAAAASVALSSTGPAQVVASDTLTLVGRQVHIN